MDKNFKKYVIGLSLLGVMVLLNMCNSCNSNNNSKRTKKTIDSLRVEINIANEKYESAIKKFQREIKIEGLRSELRMIQATDRKIFDVNRQNEIEKEIAKLQKEGENTKE